MVRNINMAYDWLNMFTKASERLYLAFFVNMGKTNKDSATETAKKIRAKHLRRVEKSKRRQAYFISDYLQVKYFQLYSEAAQFYNALNTIHPTKNDLRKALEYKNWKKAINGEKERSNSQVRRFENINEQREIEPESPENSNEHSEIEPESPENSNQQREIEPESPENSNQQHEIEPESPENSNQQREIEPESPENSNQQCEIEPESPENSNQQREIEPESPENSNQQREIEPESPETYNDRMRLEIPLLDYQPPSIKSTIPQNPAPAVHTHTLEMVTEEVLSQSEVENNVLNELTPQRINQILDELRQDPELHGIFAEVERDVRQEEDDDEGIYFDTVGANLEIEIDDRLETELDNWEQYF